MKKILTSIILIGMILLNLNICNAQSSHAKSITFSYSKDWMKLEDGKTFVGPTGTLMSEEKLKKIEDREEKENIKKIEYRKMLKKNKENQKIGEFEILKPKIKLQTIAFLNGIGSKKK